MHNFERGRFDQEDDRAPVSLGHVALEQFALERFLRKYPDPMKAPADPGDSAQAVR
jgi:hypothetical protein